jgi:hypothetical protein
MKFARDADVTKLGLSLSGKNWVKDVREFGAEGDIGTSEGRDDRGVEKTT